MTKRFFVLMAACIFAFSCISCGDDGENEPQTETTSYEGNFSIDGETYSTLNIVSDGTYTMRNGSGAKDEGTWKLASDRAAIAGGGYIFTSKVHNGTFSVTVAASGVTLSSDSLAASGTGVFKESSFESSGDDENEPSVSVEDIAAYDAMDDTVEPIALPVSTGTNEFAGCTVESENALHKYIFTEDEMCYYERASDGADYELCRTYAYTYNTSDENAKYITYQLKAYCKNGNEYTSPKSWIDAAGYLHAPLVLEYVKASFTKLHKYYYKFEGNTLVSAHETLEPGYTDENGEHKEVEFLRYYYYDDVRTYASTQFQAEGRTLKYDGLCFSSSYEDQNEHGNPTQFYALFVPVFAENSFSFTGTVYRGRFFGRDGKTLPAAVPHAFDTLEKTGEVTGTISIDEATHTGTMNFTSGIDYLHIGDATQYTVQWLEHETFFHRATVTNSSAAETDEEFDGEIVATADLQAKLAENGVAEATIAITDATNSTIPTISMALRSSSVKVQLDLSKSTQVTAIAQDNVKGPAAAGKNAFMDCRHLTSIVLPETITYIGSYAFANCESLTTFAVPDSVTQMQGLVFEGCTNLTSIHIGKKISEYSIIASTFASEGLNSLVAFTLAEENTSLTEIDGVLYTADGRTLVAFPCAKKSLSIPDSVTKIGNSAVYPAVYRATALKRVEIPNSVTDIADYAFAECPALSEVIIGSGLQKYGERAFTHCTMLSELVVAAANPYFSANGGGLYSKDETKLYVVAGGKETFTILESTETIGANAFYGCEKLAAITIPDSVKDIEDGAFYFCENLESLTLGHGLFEFGVWLKANTKLTSITIPENIKRIKCLAFTDVDARQLVAVTFADTDSNWYETLDKRYTHTEENKKLGPMNYRNPEANATLLKEEGLNYYLYNDNTSYF